METASWSQLIQQVGAPWAFALGLLCILYKVGIHFSTWLKPKVEQLFDKHFSFIDANTAKLTEHSDRLSAMHADVREAKEKIHAIHHKVVAE